LNTFAEPGIKLNGKPRPSPAKGDAAPAVAETCPAIPCAMGMQGIRKSGWAVIQTILISVLLSACSQTSGQKASAAMSLNQTLLAEINRSHAWFHAKKTRPIWAKKLESGQSVDTLEGKLTAQAGDFLCRGEAGEVWPQKQKALEFKYNPTSEVDGDGWRKYEPRPDAEGVMAAQISHPFQVQATWGNLSGKAGDYVAKNFRDRDVAYPKDVWIVDQRLFLATYEAVRP
jgi:hypothetical protein